MYIAWTPCHTISCVAKLLEDEAKIAQAEGEISSGEEKINQFKQELEKQNAMQKEEHLRQLSGSWLCVVLLSEDVEYKFGM